MNTLRKKISEQFGDLLLVNLELADNLEKAQVAAQEQAEKARLLQEKLDAAAAPKDNADPQPT